MQLNEIPSPEESCVNLLESCTSCVRPGIAISGVRLTLQLLPIESQRCDVSVRGVDLNMVHSPQW